MNDELIKRLGLAICQAGIGSKQCPCAESGKFECIDAAPGRCAKAAFAAFKPGDDLPNGLHVETSQFWRGVRDENNAIAARQARAKMQERCAARIQEELDKEVSYPSQYAEILRSLSVEPNNE